MHMLEDSFGSSGLFLVPGTLPLSSLSLGKGQIQSLLPGAHSPRSRPSTPALSGPGEMTGVGECRSAAGQAGRGHSKGQWVSVQLRCGPWQCKRKLCPCRLSVGEAESCLSGGLRRLHGKADSWDFQGWNSPENQTRD